MFNIRKATIDDANGITNVHISSWKSTYKGIISDEFLNNLTIDNRLKFWLETIKADQSINLVAINEQNEVIGFCSGGKERTNHQKFKGELYAIYLVESAQKQGIGKKLVDELIKELKRQNYHSMLVWVLEENPSKYFYERMGGKIVEEADIEIGGKAYKELGYGWFEI